jgi:hypothetical protein
MPKPAVGPLQATPPEIKRPAQENAYLDDGDDTNLDGIDDAVAVAAQAAQVAEAEAEAEAEAKSAGERLAGMMRIRGGMGAGACFDRREPRRRHQGRLQRCIGAGAVGVPNQSGRTKKKLATLGLGVPEAAPSGLTPGASSLSESQALGQLSLPPSLDLKDLKDLKTHDFRELWREKKSAHLQGTREWAFAEILKWLDDPASPQLFWLMGGGGTGKSVLTAELLDRVIRHFCRHHNPGHSRRPARCSAALPPCSHIGCRATRRSLRPRVHRGKR